MLLGSIKIAEHITTHTKTLNDGSKIDVLKLIDLMNGRTPRNIDLNQLDAPKKKNKATGFSTKRYNKADTSYPLIVDSKNFLLDGRHRYFKLLDSGASSTKVHTATADDLAKVKMANDEYVRIHVYNQAKQRLMHHFLRVDKWAPPAGKVDPGESHVQAD